MAVSAGNGLCSNTFVVEFIPQSFHTFTLLFPQVRVNGNEKILFCVVV